MPTPSDLLTSNTKNRPQPLVSVTPKPKDGTIAHTPQTGPILGGHAAVETAGAAERRITAVLRAHAWRTPVRGQRTAPLPTLSTLRITGQVRPGQHAPTESALDHEVTFVPCTVPPAHGFQRACNLRVDNAVIGWVAYGQVRGSYGWVWGDQYASHGSFRSVAPSRSAAAFNELLAAVRAGTVADSRSTTLA
ncbi:MAG TPA: hypothetical protein VGW74_13655 [Propionibacteriaceae bacterium]|nr:hypothetical protein [Propionibacteriaceae bacterium]